MFIINFMEEKDNKDNIENIEIIDINNKNILSALFKNYQNLIKEQNNEDINLNDRKYTIDDLKIKSDDNFVESINNKFEEIKKNSLSRLDTSIKKYQNCYEIFQKKLTKFIEIKGENLYKVVNKNIKNDVILNYTINNIFKIINTIIKVYENFINNIESNFNELNEFLEKTELINKKKPLEYFLNNKFKNILNCSLINKFNFKQIDNKNIVTNNYYKNYFSFLKEEEKHEVIRTFTLKKEEINKGLLFIKDNFPSIKNFQMQGIEKNDFEKIVRIILDQQKKNNKFDLKTIKIKDFDLSEKIDPEILKALEFNKIEKLKFLSGKYLDPKYLLDLFINKTDCLIHLSLEKVNINNIGLKQLMRIIKLRPIILETLEYLSLAGNLISAVKNDIFQTEEMKKKTFKKLKFFNLYKNNIYKFDISLEKMPELKLLDLSSNSILTSTIMDKMIKTKDKLILFNDNIFITNNFNNNSKYIEYLNKQLSNLDFGIKVLHLGFTYDKEQEYLLEKLRLSPSTKISLIKLDLSFCGITNNVLINFFKNNDGLFSLKKFNFKYNNIDSSIFAKFVSEDISLERLNVLDFSENDLPCKEYEESVGLIKFIEKYNNLEQLKLMNSNFIQRWSANISPDLDKEKRNRNLFIKFKEKLKLDNRKFIFIIDSENWIFIENDFEHLFSFRSV